MHSKNILFVLLLSLSLSALSCTEAEPETKFLGIVYNIESDTSNGLGNSFFVDVELPTPCYKYNHLIVNYNNGDSLSFSLEYREHLKSNEMCVLSLGYDRPLVQLPITKGKKYKVNFWSDGWGKKSFDTLLFIP